MVKLKYIGSLVSGNVERIGIVQYGNTYNVDDAFAKKLLKTKNWINTKEDKVKEKMVDKSTTKGDIKMKNDNKVML